MFTYHAEVSRLRGISLVVGVVLSACARVPIDLLHIDHVAFSTSNTALQIEGDGFPHGQIGRARFTGQQQIAGTRNHTVWTHSARALDEHTVLVELDPSISVEDLTGDLVLDFQGNGAYDGSLLRGHSHIDLASQQRTPSIVQTDASNAVAQIDVDSMHALSTWLTLYLLLLAAFVAFAERPPASNEHTSTSTRVIATVWVALLAAAVSAFVAKVSPDELLRWSQSSPFAWRLIAALALRTAIEMLPAHMRQTRMAKMLAAMVVGICCACLFAPFSHAVGIALLMAASLETRLVSHSTRSRSVEALSLLALLLPLSALSKDLEPFVVLLWLYLREAAERILRLAVSRPHAVMSSWSRSSHY